MDKKIIHENEYFIFYISAENNLNIHLDSKSKEIQEALDPEEIMSTEEKLKKLNETLQYFYNFWKLIERSNDKNMYTMYFNINLVMINVPLTFLIDIKNTLDSLKDCINSNLKESYFKVENKLATYFLNIILSIYKPIKPVHII